MLSYENYSVQLVTLNILREYTNFNSNITMFKYSISIPDINLHYVLIFFSDTSSQ